jgi:ribose-phosphate pyrophosphokinase
MLCNEDGKLTAAAVLPYFPYSRQSKKKSHRGAITARMLANLLHVAGINHVITIDLHASQMQGFFKCPVDNLHAEPLIARWIRRNVPTWREAVCVSKNAGGTKRVTSLADALKLNFGIVTTDRKRGGGNMTASMIMRRLDGFPPETDLSSDIRNMRIGAESTPSEQKSNKPELRSLNTSSEERKSDQRPIGSTSPRQTNTQTPRSPNIASTLNVLRSSQATSRSPLVRAQSSPATSALGHDDLEYTDERARDIIHGRLVQGHIVPDDYPSPTQSAMSNSIILEHPDVDPMEMSAHSSVFNPEPHSLAGTVDAAATSDDEEENLTNPGLEQMITLVGDVRDRTVFIVDDMIDKAGSWIAAAETVKKRGGAEKVYCIATHGLFGGNSLEALEECDCIDTILVTNSFPIPEEKSCQSKKLVVLDLSNLLAECIRRNHYGESISALFSHSSD